MVVPVCFKTPLLCLLTQKTAQKFGYVLGIKRITENVKKVRRNGDKEADAELTVLINSIPAEYIIEMLKNLTPSQLSKVTPYLDSEVYAENSRLRMEICDPHKMEGYKMPTDK